MKKIILYILLLSSTSLFSQPSNLKDSISIQLINRQYNEVILLSRQALGMDSTFTWAWFPKGQAHLALLQYKEALEAIQKAKMYEPENLSVLYALGKAYSGLGDNKKAILTYMSIINKDSSQLYARIELAKSYTKTKKYLNAIEIYRTLVALDPGKFVYNKELGLVYLKADSVKQAAWYMHNAVNLNNRDQNLIAQLATLYNKQGDYKLALDVVKLGLHHDSYAVPLIILEAYCYYLLQQYNLAIRQFKEARSLGDSSLFTTKYLGLSYLSSGQSENALPLLEEVFRADTTHANNCYHLSIAYYETSDFKTANKYFLLTLELLKPSPQFLASNYRYIGGCQYNMKKWNEALSNYILSYQFDPEEYAVLFNIASLYDYKLNDKKKALKYYQNYLTACGYPEGDGKNPPGIIYAPELAHSRVVKIREDLHFEGELEK